MKYYSAKIVTQLLGVTAQTLRNWDKERRLKPAYTKGNSYRYYSEVDVLEVARIGSVSRFLKTLALGALVVIAMYSVLFANWAVFKTDFRF